MLANHICVLLHVLGVLVNPTTAFVSPASPSILRNERICSRTFNNVLQIHGHMNSRLKHKSQAMALSSSPTVVLAGEMGARIDYPSTAAFLVIFALFGILILKVRSFANNRDVRTAFEKELQSARVRSLNSDAPVGELDNAVAKLEDLKRKEEESRIFFRGPMGYVLRLPDLSANERERRAQQNQSGSNRPPTPNSFDIAESKVDEDGKDVAEGSESPQLSVLQISVLAGIVVSQLFLLTLLVRDPMVDNMFH